MQGDALNWRQAASREAERIQHWLKSLQWMVHRQTVKVLIPLQSLFLKTGQFITNSSWLLLVRMIAHRPFRWNWGKASSSVNWFKRTHSEFCRVWSKTDRINTARTSTVQSKEPKKYCQQLSHLRALLTKRYHIRSSKQLVLYKLKTWRSLNKTWYVWEDIGSLNETDFLSNQV